MIFLIKHRWWASLGVAALLAAAAWGLGGFDHIMGDRHTPGMLVALGAAGALAALVINLLLHETFKRAIGPSYIAAFEAYGRDILNGMRWPEYVAGGVLAAVGEEPLFRGVVLRLFDSPVVGIGVAALLFALCHWMKRRHFGFWLWALWEGVLLGILLVATGSLLVPIIAHGLHDLAAYIAFNRIVARDAAA